MYLVVKSVRDLVCDENKMIGDTGASSSYDYVEGFGAREVIGVYSGIYAALDRSIGLRQSLDQHEQEEDFDSTKQCKIWPSK
ncbi:unnamed protein product [Protopolystoma xenopodis]|uniref:Uncharacterized protein n=1 Tax=Protopolystoma xenopodis TaxID=117903 RepID=A0A3S4ZXQ0_9PLAT|nr:unnamed protein product [Protopolystoma xenopodis]